MSKRNMQAALMAAGLIAALGTTAQAATNETPVSFDSVPDAVQGALTDNGAGASNGATASVWRGLDRGNVVYTGRIVDVDGSSRIIDVDGTGRVSGLHQFAAPLRRYFDPGEAIAWTSLSPGVQKTIGDNSRGAPVTRIVRKTAANGLAIYVAITQDLGGRPVYIETTADGALIGVKDVQD